MIKLQVIGNLGADARVEEVNGQTAIRFNIADTYKYTDSEGVPREKTTWISCTIFRQAGQSVKIAEYLKKGTKVYVEGRMQVKTYVDANNKTQAAVNMVVTYTELLGGKKEETTTTETAEAGTNDDLPF